MGRNSTHSFTTHAYTFLTSLGINVPAPGKRRRSPAPRWKQTQATEAAQIKEYDPFNQEGRDQKQPSASSEPHPRSGVSGSELLSPYMFWIQDSWSGHLRLCLHMSTYEGTYKDIDQYLNFDVHHQLQHKRCIISLFFQNFSENRILSDWQYSPQTHGRNKTQTCQELSQGMLFSKLGICK